MPIWFAIRAKTKVILIYRKDGSTERFDLEVEETYESKDRGKIFGRNDLNERMQSKKYRDGIRGVAILINSELHSVSLPKKFRTFEITTEPLFHTKNVGTVIGERVTMQADNVRLVVTGYTTQSPKSSRIDLIKIGKQRFQPHSRSSKNVKEKNS